MVRAAVRSRGVVLARLLATAVEAWGLEAWRQERHGDRRRAVPALEQAPRLAEPELLRRPFREAPGEIRRLLAALQPAPRWLSARSTAQAAHPTRSSGATRSAPAVSRAHVGPRPATDRPVERLTTKELEVLERLAALLTTEEIAESMFVSVNTVRTHVRSILRKLAASRRNEAIRRARELGILLGDRVSVAPAPPAGGVTAGGA
jgi:LuxR family maltose regulon positive regulatory protein